MKGPEHLSYGESLRELGLWELIILCKYLKGGSKEGMVRLFPVIEPEAVVTNWNTKGSLRTSGNTVLLWEEWPSPGTGCPQRWWTPHPWSCSKAIWSGPGQLVLSHPAWGEELDQMTSRGAFEPQPFCDSVKCGFFNSRLKIMLKDSSTWQCGNSSLPTVVDEY